MDQDQDSGLFGAVQRCQTSWPVSLTEIPPSMSGNSAVTILQTLVNLLAVFMVLDLNSAQRWGFLDELQALCESVCQNQELKRFKLLR